MDAFNTFKTLLVKTIINSNYVIDGFISRLHYKFTLIFLIIFGVLLTSKQYFGGPISCFAGDKAYDHINDYCWTVGIYVLKTLTGKMTFHPGIEPEESYKNTENRKYLTYYQWVSLLFFVEAACFYMPRCLWKKLEDGRVKTIMEKLKSLEGCDKFKNEEEKKVNNLTYFFIKRLQQRKNYMLKFLTCEILNLVNVVFQIYLIDVFLSNQFMNYGVDLINYDKGFYPSSLNPMSLVFPKVAKCVFKMSQHAGGLLPQEYFCTLPLNILNEKIFLFLWCWYFVLVVLSSLLVLYRLAIIMCPHIRFVLLRFSINTKSEDELHQLEKFVKKSDLNDWLLVYLIEKNMETVLFKELLMNLSDPNFKKDPDSEEGNMKNDLSKDCKENIFLHGYKKEIP